MMITVKDIQVDLSLSVPLKVRDWKALGKLGVTPDTLRDADKLDVNVCSIFVTHILSKANPAITQDIVDDLTLEEMFGVMGKFGEVRSGIDRPTSTSSIPSPANTDGALQTSTN